ncbi:MAG: hypothetical protein AAGE37_08800 [Pseudomonadota bacterium]
MSYSDLTFVSAAPVEPDTISFEIMNSDDVLIAELECTAGGKRSLFFWNGNSEKWSKQSVKFNGDDVQACSPGFQQMVRELNAELGRWEANLRKPLGAWDQRLLDNPDLSIDDLANLDEGP